MKDLLLLLSMLLLGNVCLSQTDLPHPLKPAMPDLPAITLEEAGMKADTIDKLLDLIHTTKPFDFRGMVVIKDEKLVVEEYFKTYWRATIHDIRSAGKSVTALLLGIAIDQGLVESIEQDVFDFFPAFKKPNQVPIKLKHLLTMSSGLDADVFDEESPGNAINWVAKDDWVAHVLSLSMKFEPGEKWVYNDACAMLIGAVIEEKSGMKLADFAKEHLFDPLGITEYYWYSGAGNRTGPMGNLYLSALDFAKIGAVVLHKGRWKEKQVVSESWIAEITQPRLDIEAQNPFAKSYGYFWYISTVTIDGKSFEYVFAAGNGGNLLIIVPEEKLVVSLISSAYGEGRGEFRSNIIFQYVLKSIKQD
ncbi:MAG: serine hydrolase domain-containing protein [Bacteroidia bacterium]